MSNNIQLHPSVFNRFKNMTTPATRVPGKHSNTVYKYPYISPNDFKATMQNFEDFVANYNNSLHDLNKDVKQYNKLVDAMIAAKKPKAAITKNKAFAKLNNPLFVKDFNKLVEKENKSLECPVIKKREYKKIRWQTQPYFKAILGFYRAQIKRNNLIRLQANRNTIRPLEKVVLNSQKLANAKDKETNRLLNDAHKTSFRRHIKRMREAGILTDYQFVNSNKPIFCNINPEILCLSDYDSQKTQNTENEVFISDRETKCIDNNHTTRTIINENEMKADKSSLKRSSHTLTDNNCFLQEHQRNKNLENKTEQTRSEKLNPDQLAAKNNSAGLQSIILDPLHFAKMLHNQRFTHYEPLDKDLLFYEAHYGLLNKGDFRQLVIQDLLKKLSTLWKNSQFSLGSWVNALKTIDENWFKTFTGLEFDKITIYNQLDEYNYRINEAKRWFLSNKNFNILYPSLYFEPYRKHSFQGGWQFTQQWWTSHIAKNPKKQQKKRIAGKKAVQIKKFNNQKKRMQTKVRQLIAQKITLDALYLYLDTNGFPETIIDMVPDTIAYYENL